MPYRASDHRRPLPFAMHDTGWAASVPEVYERLICDAAHGARTLFISARGGERLCEIAAPLLERPPLRPDASGSWLGPREIHQLVAPSTWRLPFERNWRAPNAAGA